MYSRNLCLAQHWLAFTAPNGNFMYNIVPKMKAGIQLELIESPQCPFAIILVLLGLPCLALKPICLKVFKVVKGLVKNTDVISCCVPVLLAALRCTSIALGLLNGHSLTQLAQVLLILSTNCHSDTITMRV